MSILIDKKEEEQKYRETKLAEENIALLRYFINKASIKYYNYTHLIDIESAVTFGYFKACRTFNETCGVKFASYCQVVIGNELKREIKKEIKRGNDLSLDCVLCENDYGKDLKLDDIVGEEDITDSIIDRKVLLDELLKLSDREKDVIESCILNREREEKVSKRFGVSQSYISQVKRGALKKLRTRLVELGFSV